LAEIDRFSLFTEARERFGQGFVRSLDGAIPLLADRLENSVSLSRQAEMQRSLRLAADVLRSESAARSQRSLAQLYDLTFRLLELNQSRSVGDESALLSLLPDHELDLQILCDELSNAIREALGETYHSWLRRIEALTLKRSIEPRAPLGASVLAAAAIEALRPFVEERGLRHEIRAVVLEEMAKPLADVITQANQWLALEGVDRLPAPPDPQALLVAPVTSPERDVGLIAGAPGASVSQTEPVPTQISVPTVSRSPVKSSGDSVAASVQAAAVLGLQPLQSQGGAESSFRQAVLLPKAQDIELDGAAFAASHGLEPFSREARQRFFDAPRQQLIANKAPPAQVAAIELVAVMFDYVVDDARMPEAAKALMWRLQQPAATLAALDPGYLGEDRRSIRRLVESVSAISVAYADEVTPGSELYKRLETVVRAVEVVSYALQARSTVLSEQVQREYHRASKGVAALVARITNERESLDAVPGRRNRRDFSRRPSIEQEKVVTHRLQQQLTDRLANRTVPASVRDFLLSVWLRHMRTAALRDGEDSPQFRVAVQVVDDLLWSLDDSGPEPSRRQLASRIPPLIRPLTQGVSDIGARPEEFQPFLDEIFLIHLRKMQKVPRVGGFDESTYADSGLEADHTTLAMPRSLERDPRPSGWSAPAARGAEAAETAAQTSHGDATVLEADTIRRVSPPVLDQRIVDPAIVDPSIVDPDTAPLKPRDPETTSAKAADDRLLTVLNSLDLTDFPVQPTRLSIGADDAIARLGRGDWIEVLGREGRVRQFKVAWINSRRTVLLLVRRPDRRALSLRMDELRARFADRKAVLIE
jgi:Protein of unknown function (DUF1631)